MNCDCLNHMDVSENSVPLNPMVNDHTHYNIILIIIWMCLKIGNTPKPNGFADHYPYEKWLFLWECTLFSDKPIFIIAIFSDMYVENLYNVNLKNKNN